jgi:methylated-DNA-[protein]-cysteine S-methyltransferase
MGQGLKYVIFQTRWGYFGLLGGEKGLVRTCLPIATSREAKELLLADGEVAKRDDELFADLQAKIRAYFEGGCVDFSDTPVALDGLGEFGAKVLRECRKVGYGQIASYGRLAKLAGRPTAGRAVGNILAKNPVPLIIPCHRVIYSDGNIGGFSAEGGQGMKKMMLELEQLGV